jgi:hypothetical protein
MLRLRFRWTAGALARSAAIVLALATASSRAPAFGQAPEDHGEDEAVRRSISRPRFIAEISAGPLLGLDAPLRGAEIGSAAGLRLSPFEALLRAGEAYDAALKVFDSRLDLEIGLGSGLRAIIGGLLLPGNPRLSDSSGQEASVRASLADWPNRFGIGAKIAELFPRRGRGGGGAAGGESRRPALGLEAELVYASYRTEAESALSGARAFAASVEARIALRLRWGEELGRP